METIRKHKELFCALGAIIICAVLILVWREYDRTFLANTTDDLYDVAVRKMVYDNAFKQNKQMWTDSVINDFKPLREPFIDNDCAVLFMYSDNHDGVFIASTFKRENSKWRYFYSVYDDSIFVDGRFITTLGMAVIVNSDIVKYIQLPRGDTYDLVEIDAIPFVYIYDMNVYDRYKLLDENMNQLR